MPPVFFSNVFASTFGIVPEDLGWIPKVPKSTDFEEKAWAIAHRFEQGRFGQVLGIVPYSLKCPLCACKWICNYFRDCSGRFGVNSEGSEIHRFWRKTLCYSLWFWTGPIWVGAWNCSKLSEMSPMCVQLDFQLPSGLLLKIWVEFGMGPKSADFQQNAWAIAHGFEHGGFW